MCSRAIPITPKLVKTRRKSKTIEVIHVVDGNVMVIMMTWGSSAVVGLDGDGGRGAEGRGGHRGDGW